jgi:hypothetical protein
MSFVAPFLTCPADKAAKTASVSGVLCISICLQMFTFFREKYFVQLVINLRVYNSFTIFKIMLQIKVKNCHIENKSDSKNYKIIINSYIYSWTTNIFPFFHMYLIQLNIFCSMLLTKTKNDLEHL